MKSVFSKPSLFLLKNLLLEGRNWYLFEKLNAKKKIEQSDKLQNIIQLSVPRCKGLVCLIVVGPRYDEFLDTSN